MTLITRYLTRLTLIRIAIVLAGMVLFLVSLDLMVNAKDVAESRDDGIFTIVQYAFLRMPGIASNLIKFACLLGGLLTFIALTRRNELAPIWGTGISQLGMMMRLLPAAALLGGVQYVVDDLLVPPANATLRDWGMGAEFSAAPGRAAWLYVGDDVLRVPFGAIGADQITGMTIFERDPGGNLIARLDVGSATHDGDGWQLFDVTRHRVGSDTITHDAELSWAGTIGPGAIERLTTRPQDQSLLSLSGIVREGRMGYWLPHYYATWLNVKVAALFAPALMLFLVVALAQRYQRTGHVEFLFLGGLAYGFGFFIFEGIAVAMGESGLLPPIIAGWVPLLALATVIAAIALWREVYETPTRSDPKIAV